MKMDLLRIYRTFNWKVINDGNLGGEKYYDLAASEELQFFNEASGDWSSVPIVEAEKPEHPKDKEQQERNERMKKAIDDSMPEIKAALDRAKEAVPSHLTTDPKDPDLGHGGDTEPVPMNRKYLVLSDEEQAKGFVRPVRCSYTHVGIAGPIHPLRDLTQEENERYSKFGYVKYEEYPQDEEASILGRFWTQKQLDSIGKGCRTVTTMGQAIAETYARNPKFYGSTYCCGCSMHRPVGEGGEFVWEGTNERVGS